MPFPFALFFSACFLTRTKARMRGKPFPAYSAWPFVRLPMISHRFLLLLAEKTMIDKLKIIDQKTSDVKNRWVSKPMPFWLQNTGRVGLFIGGGWVHLTPVVASESSIFLFCFRQDLQDPLDFPFSFLSFQMKLRKKNPAAQEILNPGCSFSIEFSNTYFYFLSCTLPLPLSGGLGFLSFRLGRTKEQPKSSQSC